MCPKPNIHKRHLPNVPSYLRPSIDVSKLLQQGLSYHQKGHLDEAQKIYQQILKVNPKHFHALQLTATLLSQKENYNEALKFYKIALDINPNFAQLYNNQGTLFKHLNRLDDSLKNYDQAVKLDPNYVDAYFNRGNTFKLLNQTDRALDDYNRVIKLKPDFADVYYNRGNTLTEIGRLDEALNDYLKAFELNPKSNYLLGTLIHTKMHLCDWFNIDNYLNEIVNKVQSREKITSPFAILGLIDDPKIQKNSSRVYAENKYPFSIKLPEIIKYSQHEKIRVGYFSSDFHNHATMHLILDLFKYHDRTQFELFAFSFGKIVEDDWRKTTKSFFDKFLEVGDMSDVEIAMFARKLEIDIAVDLKGFTTYSRTGIFSYRSAPIQINFLGYPGTMGIHYIDYIIADNVLVPQESQQYYSERIVYLPNSYQVNTKEREISSNEFTRAQMGLPENAFIFCSFNNNYKINPETFDSWMRILKAVKGSVLWIFKKNDFAVHNLKIEASRRGVDEKRLIFASRIPVEEHLKRIQLADLFLDTFPCNAHTTASDALRMGLPILTLIGRSFASRVAASLLNAVNLPELITNTRMEYESLAIDFATNPQKLKEVKNKLLKNLSTSTLYDSKLFTKNIESAYKTMYQRYQDDLKPDNIYVNDLV